MHYQPLSLAVAAALTTMSVCAQDQQDVEQIEVKGRAQQF